MNVKYFFAIICLGVGAATRDRGLHGRDDRTVDAGSFGARADDAARRLRAARYDRGDRNFRLSAGLADAHPVGRNVARSALPWRGCAVGRSSALAPVRSVIRVPTRRDFSTAHKSAIT